MSESQIVFIEGASLPAIEKIQKEAQSRKYEIDIEFWDVDCLSEVEGYWPCKVLGNDSGVEFFIGKLEKEDIESFEIEEELVKGKTHYVEMAFRDEDEYRVAAVLSSIFCKLCNGIAFDENYHLRITPKNAVRWAKKILNKGFNAGNKGGTKDLWINVVGSSAVLENDLSQLVGKELTNITFTGVWAGGISLLFQGGYSFYSNSWRMVSRGNRVFDVSKYRKARKEEMKYWESIDLFNPGESEKEILGQYEAANDAAIKEDEKTTEEAKKELAYWPDTVTISSVNWNNNDKISIRFNEIDGGFDLLVIGELTDISFRTPNKREFHLKAKNGV